MKKIIILLACLTIAFPAYGKNKDKPKKQKAIPPGLEKKLERTGELPPGWQKKLVEGEVLDPSIYKIAKPVSNMPKGYSTEPGTELLQLEDKIIKVKKNTKEILDIMGIQTE